jgi:hypothetical protein
MLAEDMLQLLTAYVDGELSPRQRQAVLRLLYQSSEAREVLRQLQENRHKIQKLPRRKLEPTFPAEVVAAIAERPVIAMQPAPRPAPSLLRWAPMVVAGLAAAVMFGVALGGVLYFTLDFGREQQAKVNPPEKKVAKKAPDPALADDEAKKNAPIRKPLDPMIARMMGEVARQYATDLPPERPAGYAFRDLMNEPVAGQVVAELNRHKSVELQVSARSSPQAMERLRHVLKKHDIDLVIDPATDAAIKKTDGKTELLVYADNLKQGELEKILKELAAEDKQAANPFDTVMVAGLSADDSQQVNDRLAKNLNLRDDPGSRQGILQPKVKPGPRGKTPTRVVAVLPPGPQTANSDPMRRFLFQPADPGSVKVLVRIRQE